jgi:hypothetical protein
MFKKKHGTKCIHSNFLTILIFCTLNVILHVYDTTSRQCNRRLVGWPKKAETYGKFTTCLYFIVSKYSAVVDILTCFLLGMV